MQFSLSALLIVVGAVSVHFALARWDLLAAILMADVSLAVGAILVLRGVFRAPRIIAAFTGVVAATVGSAVISAAVTSFQVLSPPPPGTVWMFGGGFSTIIMAAFLGGFVGLIAGIFTALLYGVKYVSHLFVVDRIDRYYVDSP